MTKQTIDFNEWKTEHFGNVEHIIHPKKDESGEVVGAVAFPQKEELTDLIEDLENERDNADENEKDYYGYTKREYALLDVIENWLEKENTEVYDYKEDPMQLTKEEWENDFQ